MTEGKSRRRFKFESITSVMGSVGTAWVFVLLIMVNLDILAGALFDRPIRGVPEIVAMSIVALVFLQIADALKVGRLTRSDALLGRLMVSYPKWGHCIQGVFNIVGAIFFSVLFWFSIPLLTKAWRIGEYVGAQGDFMAPIWPVKLLILIGSLAAAIQYLLLAWQDFLFVAGLKTPGSQGYGGER
ncbi:MAG: TRAP transporter small permease subunit [Desulfomonilaceae bacterium]|nr:TRAP transporter small permease subunit [Desulfomonilaceae bacterium]